MTKHRMPAYLFAEVDDETGAVALVAVAATDDGGGDVELWRIEVDKALPRQDAARVAAVVDRPDVPAVDDARVDDAPAPDELAAPDGPSTAAAPGDVAATTDVAP